MVKGGDQAQVIQKKLSQWFFKITAFADELDSSLNSLNEWPESQDNAKKLIGKSIGCELNFKVKNNKYTLQFSLDQIQFLVPPSWL